MQRFGSRKRLVAQTVLFLHLIAAALCLPAQAKEIGDFAPFFYDARTPNILRLRGGIDARTPANLKKALRKYKQIEVLELSSFGGDVAAAVSMALAIRTAGLKTVIRGGRQCHSACALLFLAGVERSAKGDLGVHQVSGPDGVSNQFAVGDIVTLFSDFNVPHEVLVKMLQTPPDDIYVFSQDELKRLGLTGIPEMKPQVTVSQDIEPESDQKPKATSRPALGKMQSEALYNMGLASMRPYNCNFAFDDDTAAQYGVAFYKLITGFDSAEKLQSAQRAGKDISCERARFHASRAWSIYSKL